VHKDTDDLTVIIGLSGSALLKAARKMLKKLVSISPTFYDHLFEQKYYSRLSALTVYVCIIFSKVSYKNIKCWRN